VEMDYIEKKLFFHKLVGVRPVLQEKKYLVFEFNAAVNGKYNKPYYLRVKKIRNGSYVIESYFLPDSILVREMLGEDAILDDKNMLEFINTVQQCVAAYHQRKAYILEVKELVNEMKYFYTIDYRFVEFTFVANNLDTCINLMYDNDKFIPSTLNVYCKG
ncbi:hypothetical protein L9F63_002037, partial [Diploptera punctata]